MQDHQFHRLWRGASRLVGKGLESRPAFAHIFRRTPEPNEADQHLTFNYAGWADDSRQFVGPLYVRAACEVADCKSPANSQELPRATGRPDERSYPAVGMSMSHSAAGTKRTRGWGEAEVPGWNALVHDTGVAAHPAPQVLVRVKGKTTALFSMQLVPEVLRDGCDTTSPKGPNLPKYGQAVRV
jgi:hypothetical protein